MTTSQTRRDRRTTSLAHAASPSVQNIEPVGPGLQQNFLETIRDFTYKQFNTTSKGVAVPGTLTTFSPQSGAYFKAHDIGSVIVDCGPGTASTIGYATPATVDLAAGYTQPILNGRKLDFRLNVNNIIDDHHIIFNDRFAADGTTPLVFTNPVRSVFFPISAWL